MAEGDAIYLATYTLLAIVLCHSMTERSEYLYPGGPQSYTPWLFEISINSNRNQYRSQTIRSGSNDLMSG